MSLSVVHQTSRNYTNQRVKTKVCYSFIRHTSFINTILQLNISKEVRLRCKMELCLLCCGVCNQRKLSINLLILMKFSQAISQVKWFNSDKDNLCPCPLGSDMNMVGDTFYPVYTCLSSVFVVDHKPMRTVGWGQVTTLPGPASWLDNKLVAGYQAQLTVKPLFLLKFS